MTLRDARPKPKNETLFINGPAGRLQAIVDRPGDASPRGSVVVLHPHPQHGGTMHNKVVYILARTFVQLGYVALRFNFRGTEQSEGRYDEGRGELDDSRAALAWLRDQQADGSVWLAGFSFGAAIAIRAAVEESVDGLISVAPAVERYASALERQPDCPWLIVQGDEDELVNVETTIAYVNTLKPGPELVVMQGVEHFFHGELQSLRDAVADFVTRNAGTAP